MATHLFKRGGRYYIRRRVPLDLVDHFGRKEFQKALGTSDRAVAATLVHGAATGYDIMFKQAREQRQKAAPQPGKYWDAVPREQLEGEEEMAASAPQDDAEHARAKAVADFVEARMRAVAAELGLAPHTAPQVHPAVVASIVQSARPQAPEALPSDKSLDRIAELWEQARQPTTRAAAAVRRSVDRFVKMVGNVPVPSITKLQVVEFKDKMQEADLGETATAAALSHIRSLMSFAIGKAWIENNPAAGVKPDRNKKAPKQARPPFDVTTINNIFGSRVYTEGYRPAQGAGEAIYWLPLLGLYTGARIEELCQLRPEDIYEEAYRDLHGKEARCWVLRITEDAEAGLEVKNEHSRRRIPIHAEILKRGFIEYASSMQDQRRIFPELRPDAHGVESSAWSQWWHKYMRRECSPTNPKMVFHSFRHTFKDVTRECGVSKELADALQGHTEGDSSSKYGGEYYPLRPLVQAVEKYEVHGVQLPPEWETGPSRSSI